MTFESELLRPVVSREGTKSSDNHASWRYPALIPEEFLALSANDKLAYLCLMGTLAGNTHNAQPWHFMVDPKEGKVQAFLDKEGVLPASDRLGRQSCLSVGCALGNFLFASGAYGQSPEIDFIKVDKSDVKPNTGSSRHILLASLKISATEGISEGCSIETIFSRRVDRRIYQNKSVEGRIIDELRSVNQFPEVEVVFLQKDRSQPLIWSAIAEAQGVADTVVVNNLEFSRELGEWFLENDSQSFLGMPGETFNLDDETTRNVRARLLQKELRVSDVAAFSRSGKDGIQSAPVIGIVGVLNDTPENWVKAGIVVQQIALHSEKNDLGLAFHAGLAEVAASSFVLRQVTGISARPVILFRVGVPIEGARPNHSPRLPLTSVAELKLT